MNVASELGCERTKRMSEARLGAHTKKATPFHSKKKFYGKNIILFIHTNKWLKRQAKGADGPFHQLKLNYLILFRSIDYKIKSDRRTTTTKATNMTKTGRAVRVRRRNATAGGGAVAVASGDDDRGKGE